MPAVVALLLPAFTCVPVSWVGDRFIAALAVRREVVDDGKMKAMTKCEPIFVISDVCVG